MTSISEGFADLLGDAWATERSRLAAIAQRFVADADDADAVVEHAIDGLDPSRFAHDAEGAWKAIDALQASVRSSAGEAIDAGAASVVPASLDEGTFAEMTARPKIVFSNTLEEPLTWENSRLVRGDAVVVLRDGTGVLQLQDLDGPLDVGEPSASELEVGRRIGPARKSQRKKCPR